jgi:hypothetical protein
LPPLDAIKQSLSQHPTVRSAISDQDYANFAGQGLKLGHPWTVRAGMQLRNTMFKMVKQSPIVMSRTLVLKSRFVYLANTSWIRIWRNEE